MTNIKKFTKTWNLNNFSILTDTGFEKIKNLHETIPYKVYNLELSDGNKIRCADNHIVFFKEKMEEVFVKDLKKGDKIHVFNNVLESEVLSIVETDEEENMYDFELNDNSNHRYYSNNILSHNTAIVESLANKIVEKKVSVVLHEKRIISLDISLIVAGTKYRGQFEERMKAIMDEIENNPNIILFIDELHTIIGAGNSAGSLDVSNIIKPALARGTMQIIGATTIEEYKKSIEKDGAMERRFQKVVIDEPSVAETKMILHNIKNIYEDFHNVLYSEDAIDSAVDYSVRYITNRFLPDKAIDILDEAGARIHLDNLHLPVELEILEGKLNDLKNEKNDVIKSQKYEQAAKIRDKERELIKEVELFKYNWQNQQKSKKIPVNEHDIARVVSKMIGIPVTQITEDEGIRLMKMDEEIKRRVVGQDEAIEKIAESIQRSRSGLSNPKKPASFLFLGSTGVGKCLGKNTEITIMADDFLINKILENRKNKN
jgi:ATP-dependent Clp protease ATP-binding subunit ClpC